MPKIEVPSPEMQTLIRRLRRCERRIPNPSFTPDELSRIGVIAFNRCSAVTANPWPQFNSYKAHVWFLWYGMTFPQALQYDIDMWKQTYRDMSAERRRIIARLFTVLRYSTLTWSPTSRNKFARPELARGSNRQNFLWNWPLASAMSHASRIIIRIPPYGHTPADRDRFWLWLTNNRVGQEIFPRVSTHGCERTGFGLMSRDVQDPLVERKGKSDAVFHRGNHYGMNIAVGGRVPQVDMTPTKNAVTNEGSGAFGHIIFCYRQPKSNNCGYLMVGIEASGPHADDQFGSGHGWGGEQNGSGLGLYWHHSDVNIFGMDNIAMSEGPGYLPAKYDGIHIRKMPRLNDLMLHANNFSANEFGYIHQAHRLSHPFSLPTAHDDTAFYT